MKKLAIFQVAKQAFANWIGGRATTFAAAIAFYAVLSLAPLAILLLAMARIFFSEHEALASLRRQLVVAIGREGSQPIVDLVSSLSQSGQSHWAVVLGLVVLVFGAAGVFGQVQAALNDIWKAVPPNRTRTKIWWFIKRRLLTFGMVIIAGAIFIASIVLGSTWGAIRGYLNGLGYFPPRGLWYAYNYLTSLTVMSVLLAMIYQVLPDCKIRWRDVWVGAIISAAIVLAGEIGVGIYMTRAHVASAYGAAGAVVLVLVLVYYSSMAFLLGAEITHVIGQRRTSQTQRPEGSPK